MKILYICNGNSFRSPAAEALTQKYHPDLEVESAGIRIATHIAENTKQFLKQRDAEQYLKSRPDQLTRRAIDEADIIIAMQKEQKEFIEDRFHLEDKEFKVWNIEDPITPKINPKEALNKIEKKVKNLSIA
jgi:protein-tyrosine-phosphatase